MPETSPKHIIIGAILSAIILLGGMWLITNDDGTGFKDQYGGFNDGDFNEFQNKTNAYYNSLSSSTSSIQSSVETVETQTGLLGALNGLIQTAWGGLKNLFGTFSYINTYLSYVSNKVLGIPAFIPTLIWSIIVVVIAFSIWSAIFQKEF